MVVRSHMRSTTDTIHDTWTHKVETCTKSVSSYCLFLYCILHDSLHQILISPWILPANAPESPSRTTDTIVKGESVTLEGIEVDGAAAWNASGCTSSKVASNLFFDRKLRGFTDCTHTFRSSQMKHHLRGCCILSGSVVEWRTTVCDDNEKKCLSTNDPGISTKVRVFHT